MPKAFLKKKSIIDKFRDDYGQANPILAARAERSWNNPIIRHKREREINKWAKSFQGKKHIRKLTRFNMQHEANIQIIVHERKEVNEAAYDEVLKGEPSYINSYGEISVRERKEVNEASYDEVLKEEPGHVNSYGDPAPWVIRSHDDGRVLASFQYKKQALRHLRRMDYYAKKDQA